MQHSRFGANGGRGWGVGFAHDIYVPTRLSFRVPVDIYITNACISVYTDDVYSSEYQSLSRSSIARGVQS